MSESEVDVTETGTERSCESGTEGTDGDEMEYSIETKNRFENGATGGVWETRTHRKRKRRSTGGTGTIETDTFSKLSTDDKLVCIFQTINRQYDKIKEIETVQIETTEKLQSVNKGLDETNHRVNEVAYLIKQQAKELNMLKIRSLDQEARGRRNNLIFWGITERTRHSCVDLILRFLENELCIDTNGMYIQRAHRLGNVRNDKFKNKLDPKRPIIVYFRDYPDTEYILENAYKLRGTSFGIDRDYPREILDARKMLYSSREAVTARENKKKVHITYPAKLFIEDKLIADAFPDWFQVIDESRVNGLRQTMWLVPKENYVEMSTQFDAGDYNEGSSNKKTTIINNTKSDKNVQNLCQGSKPDVKSRGHPTQRETNKMHKTESCQNTNSTNPPRNIPARSVKNVSLTPVSSICENNKVIPRIERSDDIVFKVPHRSRSVSVSRNANAKNSKSVSVSRNVSAKNTKNTKNVIPETLKQNKLPQKNTKRSKSVARVTLVQSTSEVDSKEPDQVDEPSESCHM